MSKYTPGPWVVNIYGDVVANSEDIAHVLPHFGDQSEFNAHLISAAPELLECLKDICENGYGMISVERGRAAISKATGDAT